jgi:hypothetical protein
MLFSIILMILALCLEWGTGVHGVGNNVDVTASIIGVGLGTLALIGAFYAGRDC